MSSMWLERLEREMNLRGAVILSGNTNDIVLNPRQGGQYTSVVDCVRDIAFKSGYQRVIMWNRAEGGSSWENGALKSGGIENTEAEKSEDGEDYDMGISDEELQSSTKKYTEPGNFSLASILFGE